MIPIKDSQRSYSAPVVTGTLIGLNVFVFLFMLTLDHFTRNDVVYAFGFVPAHFSWLSVITSMFLHGGWMHLIGNMLFLWIFGDNVEDILGHGRFLIFYLLCGCSAALLQYGINPDSNIPMLGASGAIYGVMGAYALKFPHAKILMVGWLLFIFTFEVPAWLVMLYFILVQLISSVGSIADVMANRGGTAFFAHIGGFIAGMILISVFPTRDRYRLRRDLLW
jgi:membrane associated rhomboid family serine protease